MGDDRAEGAGRAAREGGRPIPDRTEDRLIVALDVPTVRLAEGLVDRLDGIVSFFKIGFWLQFAPGYDRLIDGLLAKGKRVFLDAKMYDIGETVKQGVKRAAERNVTFVTVHGDRDILKAAAEGRGNSALKIFTITVLTSLDEDGLRQLGYLCSVEELIRLRVEQSVASGIDGIIASAQDHPDRIRALAQAPGLLIATPGIRMPGAGLDDHKRSATPAQAIAAGADYIVMGRPVIQHDDPAAQALRVVAEMRKGQAQHG